MDVAWTELPDDVSMAYANQILAALESVGSKLHLSVDSKNVKDLLDPLIEWLAANHVEALQTIVERGGDSLPFNVRLYEATKKEIKNWATKAVNTIQGRA